MKPLTTFLSARTNILGTILIATGSSLLTTMIMTGAGTSDDQIQAPVGFPTASAKPVIECGLDLYSPIQRTCVTKDVFDEEMKRLFAALGINASVYTANGGTN